MDRRGRWLAVAVLGGTGLLPACARAVERGSPAPPLSSLVAVPLPETAPEAGALPGRVRLVEFWSTYCAPCKDSIPELNRLHRELGPRGLEVVAVTHEDVERVLPFAREHDMRYPVYTDPSGEVHRAFGVTGVPLAFLVDARNRVAWSGAPRSPEMQEVLEILLQEM